MAIRKDLPWIYRERFACFSCRKALKRLIVTWPKPKKALLVNCPDCGKPMHGMGSRFKVPPKDSLAQWKKVELLYQNGFAFHGYGRRPATLGEVAAFVAESKTVPQIPNEAKQATERKRYQRRRPTKIAQEIGGNWKPKKLKPKRSAKDIARSKRVLAKSRKK